VLAKQRNVEGYGNHGRGAGWAGSDLIHGRTAAVRVLAYFWEPATQTLRGVVRFGPGAESHRGTPGVSILCCPFWLRFSHVTPVLVKKY
jgi:hypothetical protein